MSTIVKKNPVTWNIFALIIIPMIKLFVHNLHLFLDIVYHCHANETS